MPGGTVPCLEGKNGKRMGETLALLRFLGHKHGYYPEDPALAWECDALMDGLNDIFPKLFTPYLAKPEDREALYPELFDKVLPKFLGVIEKRLEGKR